MACMRCVLVAFVAALKVCAAEVLMRIFERPLDVMAENSYRLYNVLYFRAP